MQIQDSLTLAAVVAELGRSCVGARIDKIHLPTAHEMVWHLRGDGRSLRLLFSVRGNYARLHLTERRFENPAQPPMFCMLLRKHLEGSRILRIEQLELERVVQIVTAGRDELGDPTERALVAEITGKHANLILLDRPWGTIMGCLRTITPDLSRERQIMVGLPYDPPPIAAQKHDPRRVSAETLFELLSRGGTAEAALLAGIHSLSRHAIAQLLNEAGIAPKTPGEALEAESLARLADTWQRAMRAVQAGWFKPRLTPGAAWEYGVLYTGTEPPDPVPISPLLDAYYGDREESERLTARRNSLRLVARERLDKLHSRETALREAVAAGEAAETWRQWGEIIQAYGYGLAPHAERLTAENYLIAGGPTVTIPLDPRLSPMENAQRYFRRYQKARAGLKISQQLWAEAAAEVTYWEGILAAASLCDTPEELAEIQAEIQPPPTKAGKGSKALPATEPLHLRSSDGLEILVGKNNRQNELVTMKLARPDDWWFHTQNIPGSHVVVRLAAPHRTLPERTRDEAAMVAAYFSQARDSSKVPVLFTQRRFVKKPAGAKPGLVIYEGERTLFVTPDPAVIERLKP